MKVQHPALWGLASVFLLAGCGTTGQASPKSHPNKVFSSKKTVKPGTVTKGSAKLKVLAFWAHHKSLPPSSLAGYKRSITYLSPLWYSVTASGALKTHVDSALLAEDKKLHIPIVPIVNDATGAQTFLKSAATRKITVTNIDHIIATNHYSGVDIDFEPPHTRVKTDLTRFMTELHDSLPHTDIIVLDIVPHSGGAYNFKALAPEVSQFQLMTYDQHADGTTAGPVAALNWVTSLTTRLKSIVPSSKIYLGVALYGYRWAAGSTHATTIPYYSVTPAIKSKEVWSARYQEMSAHVGSNIYWWENRKGIGQKIALAKKDHLAGVAFWQIGYATPSIYSELTKDIGTQP